MSGSVEATKQMMINRKRERFEKMVRSVVSGSMANLSDAIDVSEVLIELIDRRIADDRKKNDSVSCERLCTSRCYREALYRHVQERSKRC